MGFLDTLLGMFGIGQPKVSLTISPVSVGRGGLVTGTVRVEGGRRPIPVTAFIAKVQQKKQVKTEQGTRVDTETLFEVSEPQGGAVIEPGQTMEWSFVVQVPADAAPSGDGTEYGVEASLDCPGWDPSAGQALGVTSAIDPAAGESLKDYFVLPERKSFRHSSVHGDYRILLCAGGFVTTWKTEISVRNADGSQRCRIPGWGKSMAVSPDGTKLVASNAYKQVGFFDLGTGEQIGDVLSPGDWIFDTLWLADGTVLASSSSSVYVYDEAGELKNTITSLGSEFYCSGLAEATTGFYLSDGNGKRVVHADTAGNVLATGVVRNPSAIFAAHGKLTIDCSSRFGVADLSLANITTYDIPGKQGTRYAGQEQHSYTHWKGMPKLSPNGEHVLIQDGSGQLWRCAAADGKPTKLWSREVVDYVEDTAWVDDTTFLAVLNGGHVKKVTMDGKVVFDQKDVD